MRWDLAAVGALIAALAAIAAFVVPRTPLFSVRGDRKGKKKAGKSPSATKDSLARKNPAPIKTPPAGKTPLAGPAGKTQGFCPLCGKSLLQGETVVSRVYSGDEGADRLCTIHGCPHCYPAITGDAARICPVCRKPVPVEGYLVARIFSREGRFRGDAKSHVHVVGCTSCHKPV